MRDKTFFRMICEIKAYLKNLNGHEIEIRRPLGMTVTSVRISGQDELSC